MQHTPMHGGSPPRRPWLAPLIGAAVAGMALFGAGYAAGYAAHTVAPVGTHAATPAHAPIMMHGRPLIAWPGERDEWTHIWHVRHLMHLAHVHALHLIHLRHLMRIKAGSVSRPLAQTMAHTARYPLAERLE